MWRNIYNSLVITFFEIGVIDMDFLEKVNGIDKYKLYTGPLEDAIHAIRADGRTPMTIEQIARKRLEVYSSGDANHDKVWWWNESHFGVYNGVAYFEDKIKVIDGDTLLMAALEGRKNEYSLMISEELYHSLEGEEFKKSKSYDRRDNSFLKALFGDVFDEYKKVAEDRYIGFRGDRCVLPTFNDCLKFWKPKIPEVRGLTISGLVDVSTIYTTSPPGGNFIGEITKG